MMLRNTFSGSRAIFNALRSQSSAEYNLSKGIVSLSRVPVRYRSHTPLNTVIMFVPQQEAWIVERMGKYNRILQPGLNILIPIIDRVKYVQSLKEIAIEVPKQSAITLDNVSLSLDGVLYLRIFDAYKASYGVEDPEFAITQLAQTTMRSELGKISLDTIFKERESLNVLIVEAINKASTAWGITCLRYEIRDIKLPAKVQEAMQMMVEAERRKRAVVLESEGQRESDINIAEGKKRARVLSSEAEKTEMINKAAGEAQAILVKAEARAKSLNVVANSLTHKHGSQAASLVVAEQYVKEFGRLAKTGNTIVLPNNTGDVVNMVTQAMSIYSTLANKPVPPAPGVGSRADGDSYDAGEYFSDDEQRERFLDSHGRSKDGPSGRVPGGYNQV